MNIAQNSYNFHYHYIHTSYVFLKQERAREKKNEEITGRIRAALACGIKVLDDAFDQLEVNADGRYLHVCAYM